MAWLESHGNLARHPKTRRLMQRMGWTLPHTIGNLHLLWYWALEYAPTGDLTKFDPQDLTCDLDLGTATPEQFIEAMIESGFLDRTGSGFAESPSVAGRESVLCLHDWPDYTSRYLCGSKFRRRPEKWLEVCELYGLPAPKPRQPRNAPSHALPGLQLPPAGAGENPRLVVPPRRETFSSRPVQSGHHSTLAVPPRRDASPFDSAGAEHNPNLPVPPQRDHPSPVNAEDVPIPHILSMEPGFTLTWWPKYLAVYKNHGYPFNAYEATQALAKLAEHPSKAVSILKHSVQTLTAHPERTRPGWSKNPTARSGLVENTT